jgi:3-oxoacyl-[acyl-carrier protein] reductase
VRALVTGGARGIGRAIVETLRRQSHDVFYTTRTADEVPGSMRWLESDGYDFDILVNNIGHQCGVTDPYAPLEDWQKVLRVNFEIAVEHCNAVIPYMRGMGWGRIVNIGSLGGHEQQGPWQYCAAKAALSAYTRCMGRTLASECNGVVMSAVLPGVVVTEGGHWDIVKRQDPERAARYLSERCPSGRFGTVDEIAPIVAFLCSDQASFAHGAIWAVDGGQSRRFDW